MTSRGRLTVVGTPIGNLEDISPRAVRALAEATVIYCEDTRRTRALLSALGVPAPRLVRLDSHTERSLADRAADAVTAGEQAVLVSDAGMPTISDPGALLVKKVAEAAAPVSVVPGPCAVSAALALSGFPASPYHFVGFLPRKGRERVTAMAGLGAGTVVIYEAATRVAATVADLAAVCGPSRPLVSARELTKVHEEVWRGTLGEAAARLAGEDQRGEWVLVLGPSEAAPIPDIADEVIAEALRRHLDAGADRRSAIAAVSAEMNLPRRRVYALATGIERPR